MFPFDDVIMERFPHVLYDCFVSTGIITLPQYKWYISEEYELLINTLRPRQNGRHFAYDIFQYIFLNENIWI